ncbi:MAG: glycosyltransferase [Bacteroidia bacterium]|nr:glycosyltransferase [Bacteroidia bacterium]MDW8334433.1 glycosyltransferase [Bacteroidia bacterium]
MKIVHVTAYAGGGAGISARRLSDALNAIGIDSRLFTLDDLLSTQNFWQKARRSVCYRLWRSRYDGHVLTPQTEIFTHPYALYDVVPFLREADVVHLHWVARFVDYPTFFRHIGKPIVWTLHDMNPFTGGCHYSEGCEGFLAGCDDCPQLSDEKKYEATRNFAVKKRLSISFRPKRLLLRLRSGYIIWQSLRC